MSAVVEYEVVPDELRRAQRAVRRRLEVVRRTLRLHLLAEGLFWTTSAVVGAAAVSLALDRVFRFNLPTRLGLLAVALVVVLWIAGRRLVRPLLLPLENLDLAELLDRRTRGVGQQISNVLQLPELLAHKHYASPSMVRAAVIQYADSLEQVDLVATLNAERRRKLLAATGALLLLTLGFCALWPDTAGLWARRWLAGSNVRWPQNTYLSVAGLGDGTNLLVPRGEISLLRIDARPEFGGSSGQWTLAGRGEPLVVEADEAPHGQSPEQVSVSYRLADGSPRRGNATQFDETSFRYELPPLAEAVDLHITGGDDWLGPITVEPIDRPAISTLEITARRPGASQPQSERVGEGTTQLLYLSETQLQVRLVANEPLASAEALDKGLPAGLWRRVDERTYTLEWTMQDSLALEFRLVGMLGGLSSKPYFLAIGLLKDREPRVTIQSSGVGRRITPVARIPLSLRATDDFGVASLALDWERMATREDKPHVETARQDLEIPGPETGEELRTEIELSYELALGERGLAPGNAIKLRSVATDACALGVQTGTSRTLAFQIVTSDELFYEILTRQREQRARFGAALENTTALAKTLAVFSKTDEVPGMARSHQVIARAVWQVANHLDASLTEMTLNDLGNAQARENLQTAIIVPLRSLHADLLSRLRTAIDGLAPRQTVPEDRRAEAVALADESVEAMQAILAQMSLWESFIDVINQLKQIIDRQGQVLKTTEEIEKKRTDELFDK